MISTDATISKRILDKFSQGGVTLRERSLTKDRVAMTTVIGANTDTVLNAVSIPYNRGEIDGTLIQVDDVHIYADAQKTISKEDQIIIGSDVFRIENVLEYNPAGTVLAYELNCRK